MTPSIYFQVRPLCWTPDPISTCLHSISVLLVNLHSWSSCLPASSTALPTPLGGSSYLDANYSLLPAPCLSHSHCSLCSMQQPVRPGKCRSDHDTSDLTCQSLTTSPGQEPKSLSNPQGVTYCSLTSSLITLSHSLIQGPTWTFYCQAHSHLALTPLWVWNISPSYLHSSFPHLLQVFTQRSPSLWGLSALTTLLKHAAHPPDPPCFISLLSMPSFCPQFIKHLKPSNVLYDLLFLCSQLVVILC